VLTFSICTSGNSIVAILCGVVAGLSSDLLGHVAPFDLALVALVIGSLIIRKTWKENANDVQWSDPFTHALDVITTDRKVLYLGLSQSFFESSMYLFVFMWTPTLQDTHDKVSHGWVFATFMVGVLLGSFIFKAALRRGMMVERVVQSVCMVAMGSLVTAAYMNTLTIRLLSFCIFEVCCGVFWPAHALMRARYIPAEVRSTLMNLFRVPLNAIVILVLFMIERLSDTTVFLVCVILLGPATFFTNKLVAYAEEDAMLSRLASGLPTVVATPKPTAATTVTATSSFFSTSVDESIDDSLAEAAALAAAVPQTETPPAPLSPQELP